MYIKHVAEQIGLEGTYVPRTYIEQIQLDQLINDVMVGPSHISPLFTLHLHIQLILFPCRRYRMI